MLAPNKYNACTGYLISKRKKSTMIRNSSDIYGAIRKREMERGHKREGEEGACGSLRVRVLNARAGADVRLFAFESMPPVQSQHIFSHT